MKHTLILLTGLLLGPLPARAAPPVITWGSDPVRRDETVLLQGEGFGNNCVIELGRLPDSEPAVPQPDATLPVERWESLPALQASERSLKFVVPKSWPMGVSNSDDSCHRKNPNEGHQHALQRQGLRFPRRDRGQSD